MSGGRIRVLLVDDDPRALLTLGAVLAEEFDIETCTSTSQALALLLARPFDVVCSDQRMPGMSGTEFLHHVREVDPNVGCVVITGDRGLVAGGLRDADGFGVLLKPCNPDLVVGEVRSLGQLARLRRSVTHLTSKLGGRRRPGS